MKKRRLLLIVPVLLALSAGYVHFVGKVEAARIAQPLPAAAASAVASDAAAVDVTQLMADVSTLASPAFEGRKTGTEGGLKARAYIQGRFEALGLTPFGSAYAQPFSFTRTSLKALLKPGQPYKTEVTGAANLIGFIKGSKTPSRYIVVSSHYDHLGVREGKVYAGADDDASGVAAMLALAAHFKQHAPDHSIVFAAFDGEEMGLRGAKAFVAALPFPREQLLMNLNLDMVSRSDEKAIFAAGTSYTPALKALVTQAAARSTVKVRLGHDRPVWVAGSVEDWTDSSDHGPFHDAGVPFLYFGVEDHADYHMPTDTADKIDPAFYGDVVKLLIDVAGLMDKLQ